ncbi:hypothetical protein [Fructobacillus ficulneus]|nr:hypothetical protein [Fructobacillus ficulneus]
MLNKKVIITAIVALVVLVVGGATTVAAVSHHHDSEKKQAIDAENKQLNHFAREFKTTDLNKANQTIQTLRDTTVYSANERKKEQLVAIFQKQFMKAIEYKINTVSTSELPALQQEIKDFKSLTTVEHKRALKKVDEAIKNEKSKQTSAKSSSSQSSAGTSNS